MNWLDPFSDYCVPIYVGCSTLLAALAIVARPKLSLIGLLTICLGIYWATYLPNRLAHYTPSSFDANGDGIEIGMGFLFVSCCIGPIHLILSLILGMAFVTSLLPTAGSTSPDSPSPSYLPPFWPSSSTPNRKE